MQQGDHGLQVLPVVGHHQFGLRRQGGAKAGHQIPWQGGPVTGDKQHPVVAGGGKAGLHARQRPLKVGLCVADDGGQRPVALLAAVGVDQHLVHLGAQALEHVDYQGLARQGHPTLVVAPHAGGTAAGQDHGGDGEGEIAAAHGAPGVCEVICRLFSVCSSKGACGIECLPILRQAPRRGKPGGHEPGRRGGFGRRVCPSSQNRIPKHHMIPCNLSLALLPNGNFM
ncbi:hypothetical protein D3C75_680720 [compost metagenome]